MMSSNETLYGIVRDDKLYEECGGIVMIEHTITDCSYRHSFDGASCALGFPMYTAIIILL